MTQSNLVTHTHEWLDANGRSSFAMGTTSLALTRRYHGLLCTTKNEVDRHVLVASVQEELVVDGRSFASSTNVFEDGAIEGHDGLRAFTTDPWPMWLCDVGPVRLQRSLFVAQGEPTTVLTYEHVEGPACELLIRPLLAMRGAHEVRRHRNADEMSVTACTGKVTITPKDGSVPAVAIVHEGEFELAADVWRSFYLSKEAERGLEAVEDLITPGTLRLTLPVGGKVSLLFTTNTDGFFDFAELTAKEQKHRERTAKKTTTSHAELVKAARNFRVGSAHDAAITAGFPWYGVRTREALFALPGLFLATNDVKSAKELLYACAEKMRGGLLPSRLDAAANGAYEVDTALYFVECVRLYVEHAGLGPRVEDRLYEKVLEVVASCASGTLNVTVDADGLLSVSDEAPTSWMNAVVDGRAVTDRSGKTVEVQALWYNALMVTADLAQTRKASVMASEMRGLARRVQEQFKKFFWNDETAQCADVVASKNGAVVRDTRMRPNQLFAASLCHPILTRDEASRMLEQVHEKLVTTRGIRTLAPGEEGYVAHLSDGERERHLAMHQGAAWPWLVGPYCRALSYAHGVRAVRPEIERVLQPLIAEATTEGLLGHIAECYDAQTPQSPHGAPACALSLAEVLRTYQEVFEQQTPKDRLSAAPVELAPLGMTWIETEADAVEAAHAHAKAPASPKARRKKS